MKPKYWWIKERYNPQLGVYYVACGPMPIKEAKRYENPLYGCNVMHRFSTLAEYEAKVEELKAAGNRFA